MKCLQAVAVLLLLGSRSAVPALQIEVIYGDQEDNGFFDSTLGAARRAAFEAAVARWENALAGSVPITIVASMERLGGSGAAALLARGGAITLHRNFQHAAPATWYAAALANTLSGRDLNGEDTAEISIVFNADIDGPEVLGSVAWHYGTDARPGHDIDFVTTALHEIGHGLGFGELVNLTTGTWVTPTDEPGIFDRMLSRSGIGDFADLREAERLAAVISPRLLWAGANVLAFNGTEPAVFTPDPTQPGSSLAHWDAELFPGELMAPSTTGAVHDLGMLLPALVDMGWQLQIPSPTPRAQRATASTTPSPTATPPATPVLPLITQDRLYVSSFDDGTVSIVDPARLLVTKRIAVDAGPLGMAASADGRRVYVANFHTGALSTISTRTERVLQTLAVGVAPNGVAVSPDGTTVVVTDTYANQAVVFDARGGRVRAHVPVGLQPSAVAIAADGSLAFVADYGEPTVAVIDLASGLRRAIIRTERANLVGLAIADTGHGFVTGLSDIMTIDRSTLTSRRWTLVRWHHVNHAVSVRRDGSEVYIAGYSDDWQYSVVAINTETTQQRVRQRTGMLPEALALSSNEERLCVANAGSGSLTFVTVRTNSPSTLPIATTPMGLAVAAVPAFCDGDCNGDRTVTVDELVRAVNVALDHSTPAECIAADLSDDGTVTVDEIIAAAGSALKGC